MSQNTEQNVRTREYGEAKALKIQRELQLSPHDLPALARHARQCFEEGAEEQRQKDAERHGPVAWLIRDKSKDKPGCAHSPDRAETDKAHAEKAAHFNNNVSPLYTHPANVAALDAEIESLKMTQAHSDGVRNEKQKRITVLEARVKELEEYYEAAEAISFNASSEQCDRLDKARATLTREGGV